MTAFGKYISDQCHISAINEASRLFTNMSVFVALINCKYYVNTDKKIKYFLNEARLLQVQDCHEIT